VVDVKFSTRIEGMSALASSATGEMEPLVIEITGDDLDKDYSYARQISDKVAELVKDAKNDEEKMSKLAYA